MIIILVRLTKQEQDFTIFSNFSFFLLILFVMAKNDQQGERTSRIQDVERRRGRGKRPSCLVEKD